DSGHQGGFDGTRRDRRLQCGLHGRWRLREVGGKHFTSRVPAEQRPRGLCCAGRGVRSTDESASSDKRPASDDSAAGADQPTRGRDTQTRCSDQRTCRGHGQTCRPAADQRACPGAHRGCRANDDVKTIDDVKGKTVAVTRVGQADYFAWQTVIEHQHWGAEDVKFVNANDVAGQVGLLQQGQVQAIAVSPPNDVLARKSGAHLVLDTATLNVPEQNVGFGVTRAYLDANRSAVSSVLKASIEAMARWKKDAAFAKGVIQKYLESVDPQFIDDGYEAYGPLWPRAPY